MGFSGLQLRRLSALSLAGARFEVARVLAAGDRAEPLSGLA